MSAGTVFRYKVGSAREQGYDGNGWEVLWPGGASDIDRKAKMMGVWQVTNINAATIQYRPHADYGSTATGLKDGFHMLAARAFLKEGNYAHAFESLNMGTFGLNDFVPGFDIKTAEWSSKDDSITFVLPRDDIYPEAMTKAAKGKTKLGVAYVVKDGVSYAVVLFG